VATDLPRDAIGPETVKLTEPIGGRRVFDGGASPAEERYPVDVA
jgi:hypothetical protein